MPVTQSDTRRSMGQPAGIWQRPRAGDTRRAAWCHAKAALCQCTTTEIELFP